MPNPYRVLGLEDITADDELVRKRYAELVRRFPPERDPENFRKVREAYEMLADLRSRLRFLLFEPSQGESFDEWIEEVRCETRNRRPGLEDLRKVLGGA